MIYLDHHAATPLHPNAHAAVLRVLDDGWANPSSAHARGRAARVHLERARAEVATSLGARPSDVVFTAGGSEACQLGIEGLAAKGLRLITTSLEHPAVARTIERLERRGQVVVRIGFDPERGLDEDALRAALGPDALVCMAWINHETGLRLPVESILLAARAASAQVFLDATQAFGKVPIDVGGLGASALAVASAKIGGPAGAGALVVAPGIDLEPVLVGGAQERGRRAGSPAVEALAGFGSAAAAVPERLSAMPRIAAMRDRLEGALRELGARPVHGALPRAASCTTLAFEGRRGSILVAALDLEGVCVSSGPACSSGLDQPSPTVLALHPEEPALAASVVRFSLGPESTEAEVDATVDAMVRILRR